MAEKSPPDRPEVVGRSSADRPPVVPQKDRQRSRITNGTALLPDVDGRSPWVRRAKDIIAAHLSDLGGETNASAAERSIIRRASVLTVAGLAGMAKRHVARFHDVIVILQPYPRPGEQSRQQHLTALSGSRRRRGGFFSLITTAREQDAMQLARRGSQ